MWSDAVLAYLHFISIFALVGFLVREWTLLAAGAEALEVEALARADLGFGLASVAVLLSGAARAVFGLKGWSFYAHDPAFHLKIGLFVLVGLLSIGPTRAFLRWRRAARADGAYRVPEGEWTRARRGVLVELHLLALIPLAAVIMARGLGRG
jgi:putative membrane protein